MRDRPSHTSLKIARATVWLAEQPGLAELLPPGCGETTARLLRGGGLLRGWHERVYRSAATGAAAALTERLFAPGQSVGLALRKRYMDDEVRTAIADGATQVLVLGAGLDCLALRLAPQFPEVTFWEVDHPATQSVKRTCLAALHVPSNLHLHPADLSLSARPLAVALQELPGWSQTGRSIVVAEGLLMYLQESDVSALFEGIRRRSGPGTRVAFSYLPAGRDGKPDLGPAGVIKASLAIIGEPWTWFLPDLDSFLRARGYRALDPPQRHDLAARYLAARGRGGEAVGLERFAVAAVE